MEKETGATKRQRRGLRLCDVVYSNIVTFYLSTFCYIGFLFKHVIRENVNLKLYIHDN